MKIKLKKPKSFVIDRHMWYRGMGHSGSKLRRRDGKQCCLGFYARACGVSARRITSITDPLDLYDRSGGLKLPSLIKRGKVIPLSATATCNGMICANDDTGITEARRESNLTKLFKRIGVKVKFIGKKRS